MRKYDIKTLISERLKLASTKNNLFRIFNKEITTTDELFKQGKKILNLSPSEFSNFIVIIAGKINQKEGIKFIHENII
jgi:predicted thioredoxin/glutaredoxin